MTAARTAFRALVGDARLRSYLVGTFAVSWLLWIPAGLDLRGSVELPVPATALVVVGAFGPMIAALVVSARHGGWPEVKQLLSRLSFRGVARRWYFLALVFGAVTVVPGIVYVVAGGETDGGAVASHAAIMPLHFLIVAIVGGGLDEEVGWRGVAQPRLQVHLAPLPANLVVGVVWALWHLPLWLDPTSAQAAYPFAVYTAVIIGHSLVIGYLYNASGGSLLVAVIAHSANNTFDGLRYAILGTARDQLLWQVVLAGASIALAAAIYLRTQGRLGVQYGRVVGVGLHARDRQTKRRRTPA